MIACQRLSTPIPYPVQAFQRTCSVCREAVWVSAALVARVDSGELPPVCLECLPGVLATVPDWEVQLHPDQVDELRQLGILDYAKRFIAYNNAKRGK